MSALGATLNLTVLVVHSESWDGARATAFEQMVIPVIAAVEKQIQQTMPHVKLVTEFRRSSEAIGQLAASCTAAIVDLSDCDVRLASILGRLQATHESCVIVCHTASSELANSLTGLQSDCLKYTSFGDLSAVESDFYQRLRDTISQNRIHKELIYRFWFPRETTTIWVVCPQIHEPGEFAVRTSPDYTYLDNLGDTDALLGLMVFLSQYYPKATIGTFSSEDLPYGHTAGNLVVIGGPGNTEISNSVCRQMMAAMKSRVHYATDCEEMSVGLRNATVVRLQAVFQPHQKRCLAKRIISKLFIPFLGSTEESRELSIDWGYFARFQNPLNEAASVLLINGIHTAGVVGASLAFGERREAIRNFEAVLAAHVDTANFECYFRVPVLNGQTKIPTIDPTNVLGLDTNGDSPVAQVVTTSSRRSSVNILFVAGDRGGTQVHQLQIPNEYHAIQTALRASKHREVVALTNPILGATRARLAEAYHERPTIFHFAGHGNDRSLSIIDDHGAVANEIPLNVEELCSAFKTMPQRVRLCVLNSCNSSGVAELLVNGGVVDFAIGWPGRVNDSAAIAFSGAFYGAVGHGRTLDESFEVGKVACGIKQTPILFVRDNVSSTNSFVEGER